MKKVFELQVEKMKFDIWYPIKSDKAFEIIILLFKDKLLGNCELNENETHFRKINIDI